MVRVRRFRFLSAPALGLAAALALAAPAAQAAGVVEVQFAPDARYADAGPTARDRRQVEQSLGRFLTDLGAQLPDQRRVVIEIKDIDLAGEMRWTRQADEIRVLRGRADWPRITVHTEVWDDGRIVSAADETISDLAYALSAPPRHASEDLPYEKRMLAQWFQQRFVEDRR